jgi:hypothetical protein
MRQSGAKLVLVGDPNQLQSVEAGATFCALLERTPHARLDDVHRQQTDWQRLATSQLSQGHAAQALHVYDRQGCIQRSCTRSDAKAQLVSDVMQAQGMTVDRAYVLTTPHFERHTIYVALSRHKEQVTLYASDNDFKTPESLYQTLGKEDDKLSTLDFVYARNRKAIHPDQARAQPPQDVQTLRHTFMRHVQDQSHDQNRGQFQSYKPDKGYTLDR